MAAALFPTRQVRLTLPPAPHAGAFAVAPFMSVSVQCRSQWCWAAVAQSVAEYLQRATCRSQQELAYKVLTEVYRLPVSRADCMRPACSPAEGGPADVPIGIVPLPQAGVAELRYRPDLSEAELQVSLLAKRPVPMVVKWAQGYGRHAIAVVGGATDANGTVRYFPSDPFDRDSRPHTFEMLTGGYGSSAGTGGRLEHAWIIVNG